MSKLIDTYYEYAYDIMAVKRATEERAEMNIFKKALNSDLCAAQMNLKDSYNKFVKEMEVALQPVFEREAAKTEEEGFHWVEFAKLTTVFVSGIALKHAFSVDNTGNFEKAFSIEGATGYVNNQVGRGDAFKFQ